MMGLVAFLVFVVLPITEIYVMVLVAGVIGWGWTLLALVSLSVLGILVIRGTARAAREIASGAAAMSLAAAPVTGRQAADAGFRLLAGILLVIPGFVTGFVGLLLLLPPVRAIAIAMAGNGMVRRYPSMQATFTRVRFMADPGDVVTGEVVDPDSQSDRRRDENEDPPQLLP